MALLNENQMDYIYTLLPKYFNKQCTADENAQVRAWKKEHPKEFEEQKMIWSLSKDIDYVDFDTKSSWAELQLQMTSSPQQATKVVGIALWKKMAAAAILVLVCGLALQQFLPSNSAENQFFADGMNIEFNGQTRGETLVSQQEVEALSLSSGDKIWLNKNTQVEDMGKQDGSYAVKLHKGEAFFDVSSKEQTDKEPFLVHTSNAMVAIVGTQFSVTRKNDKTIVRVVEGEVEVMASDKDKISIKAGEQALVMNGKIKKYDHFSPNALAWKTGYFVFKKTPIQKVGQFMETFYNVKIEIGKGTVGQTTGKFDLAEVEPMLESIVLVSGLKLDVIETDKHYKISNQ